MLHFSRRASRRSIANFRTLHATRSDRALQVVERSSQRKSGSLRQSSLPIRENVDFRDQARRKDDSHSEYVKRNEVGVQMLSRRLHSQIFRDVKFPPPDRNYIRLSREHLNTHGLDPTQGSVLPDVGFTLPTLQGYSIDEHFYRIGSLVSQPWLELATDLANIRAPPRPDYWHIRAGWTRYHYLPDGSSYSEPVDAPNEELLSFDVETMPNHHNYAIIACAMSATHWYSWLSPWLLGETENPKHLIPFGNPKTHRVVVGHNVSYDRARVLEEYHVHRTNTRFLDTMSLHVAVKGISSHQRPAWMKYRKLKKEEKERQKEALEILVDRTRELDDQTYQGESDEKSVDLRKYRRDVEESLPDILASQDDESAAESSSRRWEDITSANSLADVAKLHCNIEVSKEIRDDFMIQTREEILNSVQDYLDYCSSDVSVTHSVYKVVFPEFLRACPSPVSFAGVLTMGSSFLTVNEKWEEYIRDAEKVYRNLEQDIQRRLVELAEEAKSLLIDEGWRNDVWLSQLDWTPKNPGKSRGIEVPPKPPKRKSKKKGSSDGFPAWFHDLKTVGPFRDRVKNRLLPLLLRCRYDGNPLQYSTDSGWIYIDEGGQERIPRTTGSTSVYSLLGKKLGLRELNNGRLTCDYPDLAYRIAEGNDSNDVLDQITKIAETCIADEKSVKGDPWLEQLDWSRSEPEVTDSPSSTSPIVWPKWYWELTKPQKDLPPGTVDLTVRSRVAPLLLRLSWHEWPLFHSREHGWTFRVAQDVQYETRQVELFFYDPADEKLKEMASDGYKFFKLPHKDGESANVGNPFGKTFVKYAQDGILKSLEDTAKNALHMNAQCSYWISSRDRIMNQMVVWEKNGTDMALTHPNSSGQWGMILPQVIAMGTVTRRAIEKTWLTASNAKKNRVGSELKAMVRAPPGYAIVGADVDSEELWISSVMGDAQFGLHGATALGWMTLEGTKAAGTDLHSKTANILGISRDQAKVFNYSRIYGAGMKHAILLLLQGNPNLLPDIAQKQAEKLYASTKGKNCRRTSLFGRKFWHGGTESYVFNKLEEIALSDKPLTPALGCGITHALSKEHLVAGFGTDYMTSRINWVVQSSGVDYLHLLIVSMEYLIAKYDIQARYLISVHDELRYLVKEEDRYRAALALQIANLWTRCLFAYRLGMDDLPQGVAFFSAVDVDFVLRKEVDLPCITPSQPNAIPSGESLNIRQVLEKTSGGSLWPDGRPMEVDENDSFVGSLENYQPPDCLVHRASSAAFLRAQSSSEYGELKRLAELDKGMINKRDVQPRKRRVKNADVMSEDSLLL